MPCTLCPAKSCTTMPPTRCPAPYAPQPTKITYAPHPIPQHQTPVSSIQHALRPLPRLHALRPMPGTLCPARGHRMPAPYTLRLMARNRNPHPPTPNPTEHLNSLCPIRLRLTSSHHLMCNWISPNTIPHLKRLSESTSRGGKQHATLRARIMAESLSAVSHCPSCCSNRMRTSSRQGRSCPRQMCQT